MRLIVFIHYDTCVDGSEGKSEAMSKDIGETIPPYLMTVGANIAFYPKVGEVVIGKIANYGTLEAPSIVIFSQDIVFHDDTGYEACKTALEGLGYASGGSLGNGGHSLPMSPAMRRSIRSMK